VSITVPVTNTAPSTTTFGIPVANTINGFRLASATSSTSVTLSTTSAFAGAAAASFTLSVQTRVLITVQVGIVPNTTGSSASIGSFTGVGKAIDLGIEGGTTARSDGRITLGDILLDAGTYTAYASIARAVGGDAGDTGNGAYTLVTFCGFT
jgi:hypothetical protein